MKILGLLAVVGSCIGLGLTWIAAVRREICTLDGLARGVRTIRAELSCRLCPMRELLTLAEGQAGEDASAFFHFCAESLTELNRKSFAELWSEACHICLPALSEAERLQLETLGSTLGRYALDEQLTACDRFLRNLEESADRLRAQLPDQRRITLALSAAAGIFLCLLIL